MRFKSMARIFSIIVSLLLIPSLKPTLAQTDLEVWPTGVNGPQVWPPDLHNPWWDAEKKYPEGGAPPPVDLFNRIKCVDGAKVKIKSANSAPWENSRWHPPEYAFDTYTMSRWSSNGANDKWLAADMGESKTITKVYLVWETAYGKDYDIQVSNDSVTWTTAKAVRGGNGQADAIDVDGKGRYIRMMGVATGSPYGYSIYEFTICSAGSTAGISSPFRPNKISKGIIVNMDGQGWPMGIRIFDISGKARINSSKRN
jgi:hypothetical protein